MHEEEEMKLECVD